MFDPYETLRIDRHAPLPAIATAYRELVATARREVEDERWRAAILGELAAAYALLADEKRRARFDASAAPGGDSGVGVAAPQANNAASPHGTARADGNGSHAPQRDGRAEMGDALATAQDHAANGTPSNGPSDTDADLARRFFREFGRADAPRGPATAPGVSPTPAAPDAGGGVVTVERPAIDMPPGAAPASRPEHGLPRAALTQHLILPVRRENGTLELAVTRTEDVARARELARGIGAEPVVRLAERSAIEDGLVRLFWDQDQHEIAHGHAQRAANMSARRTFTAPQVVAAALITAALAASLYFFLIPTLIGLIAACTAFYLGSSAYKMFVIAKCLASPGEVPIEEADIESLDERTLPVYTLLLPLYREANVVDHLLTGIDALDYPREKLDVKLLLEPDDDETRAAIRAAHLPPHYQVLTVPPGGPKSKPKALNYGLLHARGEYCTIYDAEDRPAPDQLKKAVIAFRALGHEIGCVQAKLNFYNPSQNLLTRWFTADYSQWFELYLPGLTSAGAPIPLGGTSNHFPTALLRQLGGWDPYNVTEDADLGIRLARAGLRTAMIDSVTYEEANSRLGNWLRQRSHWIKGYMLTWLVHMRNPARLWRELGTHGFLSIQMTIAASVFGYFANPVFWSLIAAWYALHWGVIETLYPAPVLYLSIVCLFFANFVFVYVAMAGCVRRGFYDGVAYALLIPVYWALMTVSAVNALYQLIVKPHYWEKTRHGLFVRDDAVTGEGAPS